MLLRGNGVGLLRHGFRAVHILCVNRASHKHVQLQEARAHVTETHDDDGQDLGVKRSSSTHIATVLLLLNLAHQVDGVLVQENGAVVVLGLQQNAGQLALNGVPNAYIAVHLSTENGDGAGLLRVIHFKGAHFLEAGILEAVHIEETSGETRLSGLFFPTRDSETAARTRQRTERRLFHLP